jgi:MFS transporter
MLLERKFQVRLSTQQFQGANAIFYYIPLIVGKATGQTASSQLM